jgi:transposase
LVDTADKTREEVHMVQKTKNPRYTEEFRREAARLVLDGEPLRKIANELGVSKASLILWSRRLREEGGTFAKRKGTETLSQENQRLRREVEQLRMEREILKKAAAFFAKESR